jgi:hypothetical protein
MSLKYWSNNIMSKKKTFLEKMNSFSAIERNYEIYKFLEKCEKKKLKSCEMEYSGLEFVEFTEYYKEHEFEVEKQIEKYDREIARARAEKKKIYNQKYLDKNKDTVFEYRKKYYQDHLEELKEYNRERAKHNRKERNEYAAKWNKNNPEKRKEYNKKYRLEHPDYWKRRAE